MANNFGLADLEGGEGRKIPELCTAAPLTGGGVFTSPWVLTAHYAAVRLGVLSDQAGTLFTEHSDDAGVTVLRSSSQPVTANKGEFLSFHPRGDYFRIRYVNGSTPQTQLHIITQFHVGALTPTQSLVSATLARTSLAVQSRSMLYDYKFDTHASIIPSSKDLLVTERESLLADAFVNSPLDTSLWTNTLTGSGSSVIANYKLALSTGVTANSTAKTVSTLVGRFIAGNVSVFKAGIEMADVGFVNNKRRWGTYDASNGYFFELDGTTLYAVGRKAGVDTRVSTSSWAGDGPHVLVAGQPASYEIAFFADVAYFIINDEIRHTMFGGGFKGSFPAQFENINSGGSTSNVSLMVRGVSLQRYGPKQCAPRYTNVVGGTTTLIKVGPGNLHRINCNGGGNAITVTVYDNISASGPKIATIAVQANTTQSFEFGCAFNTGVTVVTTGATCNLTVVYD